MQSEPGAPPSCRRIRTQQPFSSPSCQARANPSPLSPQQLNTVGNHVSKSLRSRSSCRAEGQSGCPGSMSDCPWYTKAASSSLQVISRTQRPCSFLCSPTSGCPVGAPIVGDSCRLHHFLRLAHQIFMECLLHLGCIWDLRIGRSYPSVAPSSISL